MPKSSVTIPKFLNFFGADPYKDVARVDTNSFNISPGDIVKFEYDDGGERIVLVVRRWGNTTGFYTSLGTGNRLMSCFKLSGEEVASLETTQLVLTELYNKKVKTTYDNIAGRKQVSLYNNKKGTLAGKLKSLNRLFGGDNYRTYKLLKMRHTSKINLKKMENTKIKMDTGRR
tara:strand:- start:9 stop:527 length:519 start_codon:yes stop_codon:yes gene_type:complete